MSGPATHTIRLRSAWEFNDGAATRRFNRPTGLGSGERVWLVWDPPRDHPPDAASLNDAALDPHAARREVTDALGPHNTLRFRGVDPAGAGWLATVRLEIEPPAPAPGP